LFTVVVIGLFFISPRLSAQTSQSVTLAWDPSPGTNIASYVVYSGTASGSYSASTSVNQTQASLGGLQSGQTYFFAVTARNTTGVESVPSNEVSYQVPVSTNAGTVTFFSSAAITIADVGAGTPYPSTINVSGLGGTISQLTVTLNNLSHTWPNDVDILLVGPAGQKVMIFSDVGGGNSMDNVTVTLADGAATTLPGTAQIVSGTFKPTDSESGDVLPAPAPAGPYATALSAFNGLSANGTWSLYVNDDGPGDSGTIGGGWSLAITTTGAANAAPTISDIAVQSTTVNTATAAIPFTVNDAETPASNLLLAASSSNPTLVPNANIVFGGSGGNRTVTVTPASGLSGTATITVTVTDANGDSASDTFVLTVTNPLPPTVALTSPLSGASYTAPATINLAASVTANGHTITKVQFYNGTTLVAEDTTSPYSFAWGNVAADSYSVTARVVYDSGSTLDSAPANVAVANPPPVTPLPAPWQTADIGTVGLTGNATEANGVYTVQGAGNITGPADSFRFVFQPLSADGDITARINSITANGVNRCVGVMIRESLAPNSKYTFMGIGQDLKFRWQSRNKSGGRTASSSSVLSTPPNAWVRLVRTGNTLYGYSSTDGVSWTKLNNANITMAANSYVGFAVASGDTTTLNTSVFSNVSVTP